MRRTGRHRLVRPDDGPTAQTDPDNIEARLLGRPRDDAPARGQPRRRRLAAERPEVLARPRLPRSCSDEDAVFTEADLKALKGVAALVREQEFDEPTALSMTRAFARTTDRLAVWQTQLMAEALADLPSSTAALDEADSRAGPDLDAGPRRAAAVKLADLADRPRAAARLRLAPAPDRRDRAHARRRHA